MNLEGATIKPAEGKIAITLVDDDEDKKPRPMAGPGPAPAPTESDDCVLGTVVAVGAKVPGVKKGDVVVLRSWARSEPRIGERLIICDAYSVLATIE